MIKSLFLVSACFVLLQTRTIAAEPKDIYAEIIKKLEARFEPAEARPGQMVTLKIELKLVDGWRSFPTKQSDGSLATHVNKIQFPADGDIRFTGKIKEPTNIAVESYPEIDIKDLRYCPGGGTWECEAIISSEAKPGQAIAK